VKYLKLAILFYFLTIHAVNAQSLDYEFFRPIQEEISDQGINCIYKDSFGFLWIGTTQGLYLNDGYSFKAYTYQPGNNSSICNSNINCIIEDKDGFLWIGTFNGLSRYDRKTDCFKNYFHDEKDVTTITGNQIKCFVIDKAQRLWIGSFNGMNLYQKETDSFTQYLNYLPENIKAGRNIVTAVSDNNDNIWIGTWNAGLVKFDIKSRQFTLFEKNSVILNSLKDNQTVSLSFVNDSILWIGHYNQGFCRLNIKSLQFDYTLYESNISVLVPDFWKLLFDVNKNIWIANGANLVLFENKSNRFWKVNTPLQLIETNASLKPRYLFEDKDSIVWLNTVDEGFMYYHPMANNFKKYYHELPKESEKIAKNYVKCFLEDAQGNLWIATFDDGLLKFSKDRKSFKRFLAQPGNPEKSIGSNRVSHLFLDKTNKLWISTADGITVINPENDQIEKKLIQQSAAQDGLYFNFVQKVFQDRRGDFWIINQEGLDYYKPSTNTFRHYNQSDLGGFSHYKFTSITEDQNGFLWFGTFKGLNKFDPVNQKITQYFHDPNAENSLSNSSIEIVTFIERKNELWISTQNGLNLYDEKTDSFKRYSQIEGMLSNDITGLLDCDAENLWLISRTGLSKMNVKTRKILNYGKTEGLNINSEAYYKSAQGVLYFGGAHKDYYTFYASDIKINTKAPPVYISDFLLFNKSLPVSTDKNITPLKNNILVTDKIKLKYDQNSFGFEFASLNYLLPEKNQYAYKLDGFDKDWSYTDYKRRYANYTNLSPGEYLFQVKASNNDGVWNETGDQLQIIIMPPYWQTWYAFVFYVIVLALLIYTARYITIKQTRLKSSLEVEHLLRQREEEDYKQRINFFTNISHEFRTPLTLISGPLKQIVNHSKKSEWNTDIMSYLNLIQRNVKRLTELTNQLLDFRKIESGKMKLELSLGDIIYFTKKVTETFHDLAGKKSLKLEFISESESSITYFDADKLEKILSNLIANAVKFTEKGGVTVKVREIYRDKSEKDKHIEITVEDSGIGIPEDHLKNIFNPFHQVDLSQTRKNEGTGIGLALTENLVKLYKGDINVSSQPGKGSCFTVVLPIEKENLTDFVLINPEGKESFYMEKEEEEPDELKASEFQQKQGSNKNKPLLLVVEDNQDMRFYISKILSEKFQVIEAENGKEGLTRAFEVIPDIIISDVMMPELSGIELTNRLKSDERSSHIPVILLTALTSKKQKIKGLKTGADDYITKPFNEEILRLKVENLLENRSKIREQLIKQIESTTQLNYGKNIQPSVVEFENVNEIFINKLVTIIELNIQEVDFGVEKLAREIGMEASTLYKKLMALIDIAPGEFIREIRLKRAAQLLAQKHLTVTDVSFMVGYDDPKYFSKIFKKFHSVSPSEYRNNLIN